jgi:hypothetical protein
MKSLGDFLCSFIYSREINEKAEDSVSEELIVCQ